MDLITFKNVSKSFPQKPGTFEALHDVNLAFPSAGLVLLSGKSGAGKTTLLNLIGGLDSPSEGKILFAGQTITPRNADRYRAQEIGFVFQEYNLLLGASIRENMGFAFDLAGAKATDAAIAEVFALVGLPGEGITLEAFLVKRPMELSSGQRQRVAIARALVKNPSILLLDEPTGALDAENALSLLKMLKDLSKQCLVIFSTHNVEMAKPFADRLIRLEKGVIAEDNILVSSASSLVPKTVSDQGRLSFLSSLRFAWRGLRGKKVRLISSVLLAVLVSTFFGLVLAIQTADTDQVILRTQYEQSQKEYAFVESREHYFVMGKEIDEACSFTEAQKETLANYCSYGAPVYVCFTEASFNVYSAWGRNGEQENPFTCIAATRGLGWAMELDPEQGLSDAHLVRDPRLSASTPCRLPQNYSEVALTDFQAQFILEYGYVNYAVSPEIIPLKTIDELMGKTIGNFTVTGIYQTEESLAEWLSYDIPDYADRYGSKNTRAMNLALGYSPASLLIVKKGYAEATSEVENLALIKLSGSLSQDLELRDALVSGVNRRHYGKFLNSYTNFALGIGFLKDMVALVVYALIAFLSLGSLLLSLGLFYGNVKDMEKDLGILRALGASKATIASIVFLQGGLIAVFEFLLSLASIGIGCAIFDFNLDISILTINFVTAISLFALVFVAMALVSLLAARRALRQRPINIIEGK